MQESKSRSADDLMKRVHAQARMLASNTTDVNTTGTSSGTSGNPEDSATSNRKMLGFSAFVGKLLGQEGAQTVGAASQSGEEIKRGYLAPAAPLHDTISDVPVSHGNSLLVDKEHPLIRAAMSEGVPEDLGQLLEINRVDLRLYRLASWLSRFDAMVHEAVSQAVYGNIYQGLPSEPDIKKLQIRLETRQKKWEELKRFEEMQERLKKQNKLQSMPQMRVPTVVVPVEDENTCGFVGF